MGIDTIFLQSKISMTVTKSGKNLDKKIQQKYLKLHKKYKSDIVNTDCSRY